MAGLYTVCTILRPPRRHKVKDVYVWINSAKYRKYIVNSRRFLCLPGAIVCSEKLPPRVFATSSPLDPPKQSDLGSAPRGRLLTRYKADRDEGKSTIQVDSLLVTHPWRSLRPAPECDSHSATTLPSSRKPPTIWSHDQQRESPSSKNFWILNKECVLLEFLRPDEK